MMLITRLGWWLYDNDIFNVFIGDSDVDDIVMMVTLWRWTIWDAGDRINMLAIFSSCWWFFKRIKSVITILNWSPTSQTWLKHIWSPTSVTNINSTLSGDSKSTIPNRPAEPVDFIIYMYYICIYVLYICIKYICIN